MSVMLFDTEKFARIYQSLRRDEEFGSGESKHRFGWLLGYPEGWNDPEKMDVEIRNFCTALYIANIETCNRQYNEKETPKTIDFSNGKPYGNRFELLKSLKGMRYNLIDNSGSATETGGAYSLLNRLIGSIQDEIVSGLPEYEKADTWG